MKHLQKLGKALMLPVACLPICGILMGLGYWMCPSTMQGGDITGIVQVIGYFLVQAGGALINNMALLFAVGVGVGLAKETDGTGGLAGLVSYLMMTTLLAPAVVKVIAPGMCVDGSVNAVAFSKVAGNAFIGILAGIIGGVCYNKFRSTKLPDFLAFFSGKRFVAIITALISIVVSAVLLFLWPVIFSGLYYLGQGIVKLGAVGAGIYAFLNRLLIPTGLHHALNNVFWFDAVGLGDLNAYWGGLVTGDLLNGNQITWSVGMYMAGFFPCMMFGIPGAALAMILTAKTTRRKVTIGLVGSAALCAFLCGVTEPFEFAFMFLAFPLYIVYALLYGIFTTVTVALGFRAGFSFSAGLTDLIFSASLPAAAKTWLILPLGVAAFVIFFLVFYFAIKKFDLKTPGREDDQDGELKIELANDDFTAMAQIILEGVGGKENLTSIDHCITRLRLEVKDRLLVDEKKIKSSGAAGVIRPGKTAVQVIIGPKVQFVYDEFKKLAQ